MLKILHTADWHIGKILHKVSMQDEIRMFFDWLVNLIKEEDIDLLLVSGDVFDYANPSAEDRKMYFRFLRNLVDTNTKIIITGGNHDSPGFLNAPKEILASLSIHIIGEATEDIEDELIVIEDDEGNEVLVVAAVPFLRDRDLRHRDRRDQFENRIEEIRAGLADHYKRLADICSEKYRNLPVIAMGHLYTVGADPSESERDIHMGNEAAVDSKIFSDVFDYVALGHIHRPQIIGKNEFIRYSGSPISLSFSERKDLKSVLLLESDKTRIKPPKVVPIPKNRELVRIKGTLSEVRDKLANFSSALQLPAFVEIIVREKTFSTSILSEFENLKQGYIDHEEFTIIKAKVDFDSGAKDISDLFQESVSVEELKPFQIFEKKLESEEIHGEEAKMLKEAFLELLESM